MAAAEWGAGFLSMKYFPETDTKSGEVAGNIVVAAPSAHASVFPLTSLF